jgi:hypothetical protein
LILTFQNTNEQSDYALIINGTTLEHALSGELKLNLLFVGINDNFSLYKLESTFSSLHLIFHFEKKPNIVKQWFVVVYHPYKRYNENKKQIQIPKEIMTPNEWTSLFV